MLLLLLAVVVKEVVVVVVLAAVAVAAAVEEASHKMTNDDEVATCMQLWESCSAVLAGKKGSSPSMFICHNRERLGVALNLGKFAIVENPWGLG